MRNLSAIKMRLLIPAVFALTLVLVAVYGASNAAQMIRVSPSESAGRDDIRVEGYVSAPSLHRFEASDRIIDWIASA